MPCVRGRRRDLTQKEVEFGPECLPSGGDEIRFLNSRNAGQNVVSKMKKGTYQIQGM